MRRNKNDERARSHVPVLLAETLEGLRVLAEGIYLDGTYGRGGHARAVLARLGPNGRLLVMDRDPDAIADAERELGADPRVAIRHASFAELSDWEETKGGLDGVLFDLGVLYASGRSGLVDLVAAHKWFNLAALKGRVDAIAQRREVAEMMSDVEIAMAQREARTWMTTH